MFDLNENVLMSPAELREEFPLRPLYIERIEEWRSQVRAILRKEDPRLLLIVGPCSIHHLPSAYEYAEKLHSVAKEYADRLLIIMRAYFEKPRTSLGWRGFLHDPFLDGSGQISQGIRLTRHFLLDMVEKGLPTACEFLDPFLTPYFSELLTWGCIGARTSTSQPHRQLAASLPLPIGFKNSTDGNIWNALYGALVASSAQFFTGINSQGRLARFFTAGNPNCHLVLRGGEECPNFDSASLSKAWEICQNRDLHHAILVDCAHDNSNKTHRGQIPVFHSVVEQFIHHETPIAGLMMESHLFSGNQPLHAPLRYGVSITDPCLGWEETVELIQYAYNQLPCLFAAFSPL